MLTLCQRDVTTRSTTPVRAVDQKMREDIDGVLNNVNTCYCCYLYFVMEDDA